MLTTTPPSTNSANFGLQNKNSAAERISASKEAQARVTENNQSLRNLNSDGTAEFGLQDRDSSAKRISKIQSMQQNVTENHGFESREFVKNALTTNSKIINIPVLQRGSLLDERI